MRPARVIGSQAGPAVGVVSGWADSPAAASRIFCGAGEFRRDALPGHPCRQLGQGRRSVPEVVVKRALELSTKASRLPVRRDAPRATEGGH